jgi:cyclopropane fatty-acyl-phospholipid synthase-like methyltransferase
LDLGCGFGLFSLYFALREPGRSILSLDLSEARIELARRASRSVGVESRTEFHRKNVLDYTFDRPVGAVVTLDLLHHLPRDRAPSIIAKCHASLADGGIFLVKDVDASSRCKTAFTWALDKIVSPKSPVCYYRRDEMKAMIERAGFDVKIHQMLDVLPYPHVLYICRKAGARACE